MQSRSDEDRPAVEEAVWPFRARFDLVEIDRPAGRPATSESCRTLVRLGTSRSCRQAFSEYEPPALCSVARDTALVLRLSRNARRGRSVDFTSVHSPYVPSDPPDRHPDARRTVPAEDSTESVIVCRHERRLMVR